MCLFLAMRKWVGGEYVIFLDLVSSLFFCPFSVSLFCCSVDSSLFYLDFVFCYLVFRCALCVADTRGASSRGVYFSCRIASCRILSSLAEFFLPSLFVCFVSSSLLLLLFASFPFSLFCYFGIVFLCDASCAVQKTAMRAIEDSRAKLARASRELKATSTIVFEIRKILERQGFTDVSSDNGVGHLSLIHI